MLKKIIKNTLLLLGKENIAETLSVIAASLILFYLPTIGSLISFSILISYAVKLFRMKSGIIKKNDESCFEYVFDIFKIQLWFYIPISVIIFISLRVIDKETLGAFSLVAIMAIAVLFKYGFILSLLNNILFSFLGFGLFLYFAVNRKINIKIAINFLLENFRKIFLSLLPFIIFSCVMLYIVLNTEYNYLAEFCYKNPHIVILYNVLNYYLLLVCVINSADIFLIDEINFSIYNKPVLSKRRALICVLIFAISLFISFFKEQFINIFDFNPFAKGKWIETAKMNEPRFNPQLTLLKDGNVLVTGGYYNNEVLNSAEIYDVKNKKFIYVSPMNNKRYGHSAVLLENGNVLIMGGSSIYSDNSLNLHLLDTAEIFDVRDNKFKNIESMNMHLFKHFSILTDKNVLLLPNSKYYSNFHLKEIKDLSIKGEIYDVEKNKFYTTNQIYNYMTFIYNPVKLNDGNILFFVTPRFFKYNECKLNQNFLGCDTSAIIFDTKQNKFKKGKNIILSKEEAIILPTCENKIFILNLKNGDARIIDYNTLEEKKSENNIKDIGSIMHFSKLSDNYLFFIVSDENNHIKSYLFNIEKNKFEKINNPINTIRKKSSVKLNNQQILFVGGDNKKNIIYKL